MEEPTAFEERILDDKTIFPSFTFCPTISEDSHSIESFEDVAKEMEIAKSKYTGKLSVFGSFGDFEGWDVIWYNNTKLIL